MKAFILTAGFGTRLRPFTHHFPKALAPVNGIPLILYLLAYLKHQGVTEIFMNGHHHAEKIPALLGDGKDLGLKLSYSREEKILGTGGGIKKILNEMSDDFVLINGDVIFDFDFSTVVKTHQSGDPLSTILLYKHPESKKFGLIDYQEERVISILGEPKHQEICEQAMYASLHMFNRERLKKWMSPFKSDEKFCIIRDVEIPALKAGEQIKACELHGFWCVNDSLEDIVATEERLKEKGISLTYQKELVYFAKQLQAKTIFQEILRGAN